MKEISSKVANALSNENNQRLCHWLQIYDIDNFRKCFIIAYEKIILNQHGNISSAIIQKQFLNYLHGTLELSISSDVVDAYKYGIIGEVLGGVLVPTADAKLVAVENGKLKDVLPTTDSLMQVINDRLPKPANPTA